MLPKSQSLIDPFHQIVLY